jgi:hypothetical protein
MVFAVAVNQKQWSAAAADLIKQIDAVNMDKHMESSCFNLIIG